MNQRNRVFRLPQQPYYRKCSVAHIKTTEMTLNRSSYRPVMWYNHPGNLHVSIIIITVTGDQRRGNELQGPLARRQE